MAIVEMLEPIGDPDLLLVNAERRLRGLPPSELEWVCQHSCAPEKIPGCQDVNCEAMLIVNHWELENVRGLVERGDLAAFDGVPVQLKLDVTPELAAELQRLAGGASLPSIRQAGRAFTAAGSLLAFARLCARGPDLGLSGQARGLLQEIERILTWSFSSGGPALFNQRFVDLRASPAERGNTLTFLARADWPGRALVAWEQPAARRPRRKIAPPAIPQANAGFGLWLETGQGIRLGYIDRGLAAIPGDLYGPTARLVLRVDQEVVDRVRGLCEALAAWQPDPPFDAPMLDLLEAIARELGLPIPFLPPPTGQEETSCARPAQFIRRLLLAQPLPPVQAS